jgi:hypothetical protein
MVLVQIQPKPTFDFTVGGAFDPFNNYTQFLALPKHLKIPRAYKEATNLISTGFTDAAHKSIPLKLDTHQRLEDFEA